MNHIPSPIPKTSDDWLEHDIKAKADDFELPAQACDLSGEGTCEACQ
jgi:hypothetical protein